MVSEKQDGEIIDLSFLEKVLQTKEAKEALGEGILALFKTGNADQAIDKTLERGKKNGSLPAAKLSFILDALGL